MPLDGVGMSIKFQTGLLGTTSGLSVDTWFQSRTEKRQASMSHTVVLFSAYEKVLTQSPNLTLSPRVRKILSATGRRARADKILFGCVE